MAWPPHAVVVPYPGSGNIDPALQLAKLLHRHSVHVTFVNTERNHRRVEATEGAAAVRGRDGRFRFETIPDGLVEDERDAGDYDLGLSTATSHRCAAPLRELIVRLNGTAGSPPVTCVLPTALMSFALGVALEHWRQQANSGSVGPSKTCRRPRGRQAGLSPSPAAIGAVWPVAADEAVTCRLSSSSPR